MGNHLGEYLATRRKVVNGELVIGQDINSDLVLVGNLNANLGLLIEADIKKHQGLYGICVDCEKPIPEERLKIVSTAERCVYCQEEYERNK